MEYLNFPSLFVLLEVNRYNVELRLYMNKEKEKLNQFVQDIEFLLISVIQGVALASLANYASNPIGNLQFEYYLYVLSGFILILNFWAQAILHTLSFIDWPIDLPHYFLYFLVSFIEVIAFSYLTNPLRWFAFISLFFIVASFLYLFDLLLIVKHEKKLEKKGRGELYKHIVNRQKYELYKLLPLGFIFNILSFCLILFFPQLFIIKRYHILLVAIQVIISLFVMIDFIKSFNKRSYLISH